MELYTFFITFATFKLFTNTDNIFTFHIQIYIMWTGIIQITLHFIKNSGTVFHFWSKINVGHGNGINGTYQMTCPFILTKYTHT